MTRPHMRIRWESYGQRSKPMKQRLARLGGEINSCTPAVILACPGIPKSNRRVQADRAPDRSAHRSALHGANGPNEHTFRPRCTRVVLWRRALHMMQPAHLVPGTGLEKTGTAIRIGTPCALAHASPSADQSPVSQ